MNSPKAKDINDNIPLYIIQGYCYPKICRFHQLENGKTVKAVYEFSGGQLYKLKQVK